MDSISASCRSLAFTRCWTVGHLRAVDRPGEPCAAGFFAIGAYVAGMLTCLPHGRSSWRWQCRRSRGERWPAPSVSGAAGEGADAGGRAPSRSRSGSPGFLNFDYQVARGDIRIGTHGGEGFRRYRYFPEHGWTDARCRAVHMDRGCAGDGHVVVDGPFTLRCSSARGRRGRDRAQSSGINITAVKVRPMTIGGVIVASAAVFAHYTTHIEHVQFGVVLADLRDRLSILGGLSMSLARCSPSSSSKVFARGLRFLGDWRNLRSED